MSSDTQEHATLSGFVATLNSRLGSQARVSKAIAFAWLCGGGAIAAVLVGSGVALALAGYSHMISVRSAAEETAKALVDALQHAELKAQVSGTMSLTPDSQLRLARGQIVRLDEGATVRMDPSSSVHVVGDLKVEVPQPFQADTTSASNDLPITDYTIFRNVTYGSGRVVSGWQYDLSDSLRPKFEYCYYSENIERGLAAKYTLAVNGSARRPSEPSKTAFDFDGAVANCFWFSGF
jgi:hypothetical protein